MEWHSAGELARIRTNDQLAEALHALSRRRGLTLVAFERATREYDKLRDRQALKRSTVSDAFRGKSRITKSLLLSVLDVCGVRGGEAQGAWVATLERVMRQDQGDRLRVDEATPRELGIHSAITAPDSTDDLPTYVQRDFDFDLRTVLSANGPDRGAFVVMVGASSTGKTRSLYEAVYELFPDWSLVQPSEAADLLELKSSPPRNTVFWLDELQQYLGGRPPLTSECVRTLLRHGNVIVGTLWPDQYATWTSASEDIRRVVKSACPISVPDSLTMAELNVASGIAERDSRIRVALHTRDAGLTQALAGGPALVMCWEQPATPYAKAIITAAADGHRLGVHAPLSPKLLADAMFGYLKPAHRVKPAEVWLAEALPHATKPLHGDVSALSPVDDGVAGTLAGYTIADYLAQHLRRVRRTACVPHEAWHAFITHLHRPSDLRRLANAATARLRYRYAEPALERLADEFDDGRAAMELADLLIRQDRFGRAVDVLRRRLAADPRDWEVGRHLSRTQELWQRVEGIRPAADAGDPAASQRLAEILVDCGISDDLRIRERNGDLTAAERLVERLMDRGCIWEICTRADQGQVFAAEALADLYLAWGEVDLLMSRAEAGDRPAQLRLAKRRRDEDHAEVAAAELAELRAAVDDGKSEAALQLCGLLFELRDEAGLTDELNAGTNGAADRLLALYTATGRHPPEDAARLRSLGLNADGSAFPGPDSTLR
ncbi:tetratricopeptide repeat protein [Nonomuraea sp. LPB2021202275-12-8]|uniref:tetratricopeptide repeat protein n=1 Tax=Nonomuraea sp. LPB2021202275-12-8 TaxID=3120159 RepID=UPI00300CE4AD